MQGDIDRAADHFHLITADSRSALRAASIVSYDSVIRLSLRIAKTATGKTVNYQLSHYCIISRA